MGGGGSVAAVEIASLALLIGVYCWYVRGGRAAPVDRTAAYRRWMSRAPLMLGGSGLVALLIAGRLGAVAAMPDALAPLVGPARAFAGFGDNIGLLELAVLAGLGAGALIGWGLAVCRRRGGQASHWAGARIAALLPRTRGEARWSAALAVSAGLVEELFFRLALPLFVASVTGNAWVAMAVATALFALAHRYQGWVGVAFSALIGGILAILYLATGHLWFAMLVHALLNLNALVLRPMLVRLSS